MRRTTAFEKAQLLAKWTIVAGCLAALFRAAFALTLPFQVNYAEGPLLSVAVGIMRGWGAYPASSKLPYTINCYGPVAYYLIAAAVKLFGVSFTVPRLLVMTAAVCSAVLVALLVRHWTASLLIGFLFGALYLTMPTVQEWLATLRVDMFAVALSLAGLYVFVKSSRSYLSVPFFVAALFCKFSYVAAPVACFLALLLQREFQKAFRFAAACVVLASIVLLSFQRGSGGWFAFHAMWSQLGHHFNGRLAATSLLWELLDNSILLLLAGVILIFGYKRLPRNALLLPLIYFCISSLTLVARGKEGADSNYYLEWDATLCLIAGVGYGVVYREARNSRAVIVMAPVMLACVALSNLCVVEGYRPAHFSNSHDDRGCRDAYRYIGRHPASQILTENLGAAVLNAKYPLVSEPFLWTRQVVDAGWPDNVVLDLIGTRKIALIVLGGMAAESKNEYPNRWPRPVLAAIDQNYELVNVFDCTDARFIYEPNPGAGLTDANSNAVNPYPGR